MPAETRSRQAERPLRLTAADWIQAALEMLISDGIDAVQITVLARRLSVTRGSFYWHFDSREALLDALIAEWRNRNTGVIVDAIAETDTLDAGVLALFSVWTDHTRFDPRLDQAIRDWARYGETLHKTVQTEDDARVAAISELFKRHGYTPSEAFIRARVIYFTQLSYYALNMQERETPAERLSYLPDYFLSFTGRAIDPQVADGYLARLLQKDRPG